MTNEEAQMRRSIEAYLLRSAPVRWVNWISKCPDPQTKRDLEFVLFEDGRIRVLTDPKVADEVLNAIYHAPPVMELVIADLAGEVDHIQKQGT